MALPAHPGPAQARGRDDLGRRRNRLRRSGHLRRIRSLGASLCFRRILGFGRIRGRSRGCGLVRGFGHWFRHYGSGHVVDRRLTEPDTYRMELTEVGIH